MRRTAVKALKNFSLKIAIGACLAYAFVDISFGVLDMLALASPLAGILSAIISSLHYSILKIAILLVLALASFLASVVVLVRRADSRLVGFLALAFSGFGLSQVFEQVFFLLYIRRVVGA